MALIGNGRKPLVAYATASFSVVLLLVAGAWLPSLRNAVISPSSAVSVTFSRSLLQTQESTDLIRFTDAVVSSGDARDTKDFGHCKEIYGVLPCSTSISGNVFLMLAYGYMVLIAAQLISEGSEMLLQILDPGIIGGLLLPVLGAFPDTLLILVSGIRGGKGEAQEQVLVGMGVLAGSTIMILTIAWSGSLLCGRCDLEDRRGVGLVAKDRTLTVPWDIWRTGVTTDEQTRLGAWIMIASLIPFVIMQIPALDGGDLRYQGRIAALIGLVLSVAGLIAYCTYQVLSPWLQEMRMSQAKLHYIRTLAVRDLHNMAAKRTWGPLINPDGSTNHETLEKVFHNFDQDQNESLTKHELKALILGLGIRQGAVVEEEELAAWMQEFDVDSDEAISKEEFVRGMSRWMRKVAEAMHPTASLNAMMDHHHSDAFWHHRADSAQGHLELLEEAIAEEDDDEEDGKVPKTPLRICVDAALLIAAGAALAAFFADPVVDSVTAFSRASGIPAFFVAFVATPLASNASELVSSLMFAMKKRKRIISLTYSQVYGAITMNNTMCLGTFLALVYFRGLLWEFSAEVTIILLVTSIVGVVGGTRHTFPTWLAFPVLALYPLSLLLVVLLDYVLGWK